MRNGVKKLSKDKWYSIGGFANPRCWRRMVDDAWHYYYTTD